MRRAAGLEAAVIDNAVHTVAALDPADARAFEVRVAGPAALIVAKMHKLLERLKQPNRLNDKDAHDIYRILRAIPTTDDKSRRKPALVAWGRERLWGSGPP